MAFGLDISDFSIEALKLKKSFGKIKFSSTGRLEIPAGLFLDGTVIKKKELAEAIKKVCKTAKPHPIRDKKVIVALPESKIFSHIFKFPKNLNRGQLANVLKFEVPNVLPVTPEEVYSDFLVLGIEGEEQEIFYVACPKKIIDELREVFKKAGLEVAAFDIETASLARALVGKGKKEGAVIVDIGARNTVVAIFDRGIVRSSVTVKVAGNLFTEEISKKLKVKPEQAEEMKKTCGLTVPGKKCREGKVFLVLQSMLPPVIEEIKKSVKYYENKSGRKIKKVIIDGGSKAMPGIADYFSTNLGLEVEIGKPRLLNDATLDLREEKIIPFLSSVFGSAERALSGKSESSGINLVFDLEKMAKKRGSRISKRILLYFLIAAAAVAVGYWGFKNFWPQLSEFSPLPQIMPDANRKISVSSEIQISTLGVGGEVQGRIIEIIKEGEKFFPATGKEMIPGQASGKVKIFNNSANAQTLVVRTRLLAPEGILFRLKEGVAVPAGESIDVEVYADEEGVSGNIGPTRFTIPGLSGDFQKLIYAESGSAMTGGFKENLFVSAADVGEAKIKLLGELASGAENEVRPESLRPGESLLPMILRSEITEIKTDPEENKSASQFKIILKVKIKLLAVLDGFEENRLRAELSKIKGKDAANYKFENINYFLVNFDEPRGLITVRLSAEAVKI